MSINFYPTDFEKFRLLDKALRAISPEDLAQILEADIVVSRLKGDELPTLGPIEQIFNDHVRISREQLTMRAEIASLRMDLQSLIRIVSKPYDISMISEINNLKSRNNIY